MKRLLITVATALAVGGAHVGAQQNRTAIEKRFASAEHKASIEGDLKVAIEEYKGIVASAGSNRAAAARALLRMAEAYQKLGDAEAQKTYQRIVNDFGDQKDAVTVARARLSGAAATFGNKQAATRIWVKSGIGNFVDNTPSTDGRYIAFTNGETGDLGIHDFVTGTDRMLTKTAASADNAGVSAVSRDGRYVAFSWDVGNGQQHELRVRPLSGDEPTSPRTLYRSASSKDNVFPYGWTPDGKQLLVVHVPDGVTSRIAMMSVADGSMRAIKSLSWQNPRVSLSPDGRYVAYYSFEGEAIQPGERQAVIRNIVILAVDGSRETILTRGANAGRPVWTADGANVLFLDNRTGSWSIWRAPVADGKPNGGIQLVKEVANIDLIGSTQSGAVYYRAGGVRRPNIYVANVGANGSTTELPTVAVDTFLNSNVGSSLSPTGEYLAYYSNNGAPFRLKIRTVATGQDQVVPITVAAGPLAGAGPMWLADNRTLFVFSVEVERGGWAIHKLDTATGVSKLVRHFTALPRGAAVSPDGTALFYSIYDADDSRGTGRIVRIDLATGQESGLRRSTEVVSLAVSADGKQLAYLGSDRGSRASHIAVMPATGGEPREVFRRPDWMGASLSGTLSWTPDQQHLLFVHARDANTSVNRIWRVPARGGEAQRVSELSHAGLVKNPQMHPDGRRIFFSGVELDPEEMWSLENVLPIAAK